MAYFCTSCGAEIPGAAAFCQKCGKAVPGALPAPAATIEEPRQGLEDNVAAALAYLLFPAIFFLVVEPYDQNRYIRFHSFQAIFYNCAWVIINGIFRATSLWHVPALHELVSIAMFIGWLIALIKANQGEMFKLPIVGDIAEKLAAPENR